MKLGPATKQDKRNKTTYEKFDNDVMLVNYDVIIIFPVYGQFEAIQKPGLHFGLNLHFNVIFRW